MTTCKFYQVLNCHELPYHSTSFRLSHQVMNSHLCILGTKAQRVYEDIEQVYQILNLADDRLHLISTKCIYNYTYCRKLKSWGHLSRNWFREVSLCFFQNFGKVQFSNPNFFYLKIPKKTFKNWNSISTSIAFVKWKIIKSDIEICYSYQSQYKRMKTILNLNVTLLLFRL